MRTLVMLVLCLLASVEQASARHHYRRHHSVMHHHGHSHHASRAEHARRGDGCRSGVAALSCVTPPLAAKAREIVSACGSAVVSAVSGRPNRSNHPSGRAVDLAGNPSCIYAHLRGWPGGYSTDYSHVRHVHVSYSPGGQEWGIRFAHGSNHASVRYARHRGTRYASVATSRHARSVPSYQVTEAHAVH